MQSQFNFIGTGIYLPKKEVKAADIDKALNRPQGWALERSRIEVRRHADETETFSYMGTRAMEEALSEAKLCIDDLDLLISASATGEQPLPYQASLLHRELKAKKHFPTLDVNTTCLSFVTALEIASMYLSTGRCRRVGIISSEISSVAINWNDPETAPLFGDGAAAVILEAGNSQKGLIHTLFETYSEAYDYCRVQAGASRLNFRRKPESDEAYMFEMHGKKLFKLVSEHIEDFTKRLLRTSRITMSDLDLVVPHQASSLALHHVRERLQIPEERFVNIISHHGNQVAASIPIALIHSIRSGRIRSGTNVLLIGSSAGVSLGGAVLRF